jgi:hypothetical protein
MGVRAKNSALAANTYRTRWVLIKLLLGIGLAVVATMGARESGEEPKRRERIAHALAESA